MGMHGYDGDIRMETLTETLGFMCMPIAKTDPSIIRHAVYLRDARQVAKLASDDMTMSREDNNPKQFPSCSFWQTPHEMSCSSTIELDTMCSHLFG